MAPLTDRAGDRASRESLDEREQGIQGNMSGESVQEKRICTGQCAVRKAHCETGAGIIA